MRFRATLALAGLLGACATTGRYAPAPNWLVGTWLMLAADIEHPLACASGLPIRYDRDGTYALFEELGTWRLEGDRLIETATEMTEAGDPDITGIGVPYRSRIDRRSRNEFRKTYADGAVETFRRCPEPE